MGTPQAAGRHPRQEPVAPRRPATARLGRRAGVLTALTAAAAWIMAGDAARLLGPQHYAARTGYRPPAGWYARLNRLLGVPLTSMGWAPRDAATLEVRGRATGRTRRTPVLVTRFGDGRYLVALAGQSQWVRNVRAADGHAWLRRGSRTAVTLEELPVPDRAPVLLAYLQRPGREGGRRRHAEQARHYFGTGPDPGLADLAEVAGYYPVFRIHDTGSP